MEALLSVGIDIGTSTTQLLFSRLSLANTSGLFRVPKVSICEKTVLYRSEIYPTPMVGDNRIDGEKLREIVASEYAKAGIPVGGTDTGAVIITGESARKENAAEVLRAISGFAGEFVVATAGPDLESRIAGQGSGAAELSRQCKCAVVNLDIGGGTTNLGCFDNGAFVGCACFDIGGKMLTFSPEGVLTGISQNGKKAADFLGLSLRAGTKPSTALLEDIANTLAETLKLTVQGKHSELAELLRTSNSSKTPLKSKTNTLVTFSGGVADCLWNEGMKSFEYGDFGVFLGDALRKKFPKAIKIAETIRATVIGAGSHTTQLSGSTVSLPKEDIFPLQNLPVYCAAADEERLLWRGEFTDFARDFGDFLRQTDTLSAVLELEGTANPTYSQLCLLARALAQGLSGRVLIVVLHQDNAKVLGQLLRPLTREKSLIVLDSIQGGQNTYLDIAKPVMGGLSVPVVVKTLALAS
ncbi:MAG: ethanolamine ammonia-lyase reactivating factor EutA [Oscillospiraceae bacterium]|nr:ethanolamine ammonia-lyase reactivating factor EutA [Oscillospiraceae bacterium]